MSYPLCGTQGCEHDSRWPQHSTANGNGKAEGPAFIGAVYVKTTIDPSVTNLQAAGETIARWNQRVGERFLLRPGKGEVTLTLNT